MSSRCGKDSQKYPHGQEKSVYPTTGNCPRHILKEFTHVFGFESKEVASNYGKDGSVLYEFCLKNVHGDQPERVSRTPNGKSLVIVVLLEFYENDTGHVVGSSKADGDICVVLHFSDKEIHRCYCNKGSFQDLNKFLFDKKIQSKSAFRLTKHKLEARLSQQKEKEPKNDTKECDNEPTGNYDQSKDAEDALLEDVMFDMQVEYSREDFEKNLEELRKDLHQLIFNSENAFIQLIKIADEMDDHFERISKAKIGGSATAIVGGVLAAVGFGLSFVTFGASLGLSIAGGVIAGIGGATTGGATIADLVISRKTKKAGEEAFSVYNKHVKIMVNRCVEIAHILGQKHGDEDTKFGNFGEFLLKLVFGAGAETEIVSVNMLFTIIVNGLRIGSYFDDTARLGLQSGATVFRTLGTTAGRAVHIAGGVAGVILLPVDVVTLVFASIDVHKDNAHSVARNVRNLACQLEDRCPATSEVDRVIDEALSML